MRALKRRLLLPPIYRPGLTEGENPLPKSFPESSAAQWNGAEASTGENWYQWNTLWQVFSAEGLRKSPMENAINVSHQRA